MNLLHYGHKVLLKFVNIKCAFLRFYISASKNEEKKHQQLAIMRYDIIKCFTTVAKEFNVARQQVSRWVKQREQIFKTKYKTKRFRKHSSINKAKYQNLEVQVNLWIENCRQLGGIVSGFAIKVKAAEINNQTQERGQQFKVSDGWLRWFLKRHNYSLRRLTTTGRDLPSDCLELIEHFLNNCETTLDDVNRVKIINMDETSIYLGFPANYTYAKKGSRRVKCTTSGNERTRMSAA